MTKPYFVADGHCDTLYGVVLRDRKPENCTVTPERLKVGGVGMQTFALFSGHEGMDGQPFERARAMYARMGELGVPLYLGALPDEPPEAPGGVLSIEGGELIEGSVEKLDMLLALGRLRAIALTWNNVNEIGHPMLSGDDKPLTPFGRALLQAMDARGVLADVSHLNEAGFWDVAERMSLPPIATHSCMRALCSYPRNLTDEQTRAIIERGGFIGINFYSAFLRDGGNATVEDVCRHIDHVAQMGGIRNVGFGSDYDGIDEWPDGLGDPSCFPALAERLLARGYGEEDVQDICGRNLWRLYKRAEQCGGIHA